MTVVLLNERCNCLRWRAAKALLPPSRLMGVSNIRYHPIVNVRDLRITPWINHGITEKPVGDASGPVVARSGCFALYGRCRAYKEACDGSESSDLLCHLNSLSTMWTVINALRAAVSIASIVGAFAASSPPSGAITVGGSSGKYSTIAAALQDTSSNVYFIYPGTYKEQIYINRPNVKIYGQTSTPLSYTGNTVTITDNIPASTAGSDDASGTVRIGSSGTGVSLYNLNIANTYGKPVDQSQAIALSIYAGQFGGYGLNISGYQDTLLAQSGAQFISKSLIIGAVDYIFGQHASLWVTKSVIQSIASGCITASGRSSNDGFYYVIDSSTVTGSSGVTSYLGRPWSNYARVIFQNTALSSVVPAAGWSIWSSSTPNTDHVTFAEYGNTGAGASGTRASFATKLSAPIPILTVLNSTSWIDASYL